MVEGGGAGGTGLRLAAVIALVLINGFFVAAEFALVAVRRSRVDQLAEQGDRGARRVQQALTHLDRYISSTQLGITLASLALGWIGEPALAALIDRGLAAAGAAPHPAVAHSAAAVAVAFALITFLHIVLGELAPKSLALVHPERVSRWVVRPLVLFSRLASPFVWLLNGAASGLLRVVGVRAASEGEQVHSPEELRLLVTQSRAHGALDESDTAMLVGVFDFHEKTARDVMRPRTQVAAIPLGATEAELRATVRREQYSRYPVYRSTLDDVVGVFLVKDLLIAEAPAAGAPFALGDLLREPIYVPESRPAARVLDDLRRSKAQMAVVLDEFAGTAGILTIEDLIEEVVGDIADEYDVAARAAQDDDGVLQLPGALSLVDARSDHRLAIPAGEWTTLGGYVFDRLGRVPRVRDRVEFPRGELEVVAMEGRRVATVRAYRRPLDDVPAGDLRGAHDAAAAAGRVARDRTRAPSVDRRAARGAREADAPPEPPRA